MNYYTVNCNVTGMERKNATEQRGKISRFIMWSVVWVRLFEVH